ncbi:uncharacterized protein LOC113519920 isoform X1 [Galleria mellonella]|uniref:Uncharacterized protein LOC113519920 isoform X1 n=1 Tax=Galleria mellonella TaxID=7137 RepID=A0A6J1WWZ4_GALME|nr:uncharacterized protein LOC113519920 isoform X1 [Galleria mellonella]
MLFFEKILEAFYIMWQDSAWSYLHYEFYELIEWAKCGEGILSTVPTVLWAMGAAAIAHRLLTALFRRFMFRQIPLWEIMLQNLLFIWMVIYSLHFWMVLVKVMKLLVEYCYKDEHQVQSEEHLEGRKIMQQWLIWMCGVTPLAVYIQTRPRPEPPPLMIWITTSPWQRREMGPHGYYLNRPLSSLQSTTVTGDRQQTTTLRRAFSDSKIMIKETPKKRRYSKSV